MVCGTTIEWRSWSDGEDKVLPTGERQDVVYYPPEAAVERSTRLDRPERPRFLMSYFARNLVRRLGGFEEQFTGLYDDQVLNLKVYLSAPVFFSSTISQQIPPAPGIDLRDGTQRGEGGHSSAQCFFWNGWKDI